MLDHVIVMNERHRYRLLREYVDYYNEGLPPSSRCPGIYCVSLRSSIKVPIARAIPRYRLEHLRRHLLNECLVLVARKTQPILPSRSDTTHTGESSLSDHILGDRKKALEDSFFAKKNEKLLEKMKAERRVGDTREALAKISGIENDAVLDKLSALGIEADTWAAVSIVPLVEVAWADGKIDEGERKAVLSAADANGIAVGSQSHGLLENWLSEHPEGQLLEAWELFIVDLCAELDPGERDAVRDQVVGSARMVADATGGFLGLGNKTSAVEEAVLTRLAKAFES